MKSVGDKFPKFISRQFWQITNFVISHLTDLKKRVNFNNDATGRNVTEVLRALEATQNPGLTGCDWQQGDATL